MLNKGFLPVTIISLVFVFLIARGCGSSSSALRIEDVGVGVSNRTQATLDGQVLDLTADLDPSQAPEMVKQAYMKGAQLKKEGKDLLAFVIQELSNSLAGVSTIDLNEDNTPDPILVVPEGNEEQMTFSIRVPDPEKVKTYPDDAAQWHAIATDKAIEVLSVTVFPRIEGGKLSKFDVEARPNSQMYEGRSQHYHGSFGGGFFTGMLVSRLFFGPSFGGWYGPSFYSNYGYYNSGYYGRNYGGRDVDSVRRTRTTYSKATPSSTGMKTTSGKPVSSSMANQRSSAVSKYKSSAISKRDNTRVKKASGFGSSKPTASKSSGWGSSQKAKPSSSSSGWGWGRSSGRSSWGGGGSRFGK